MKPLHVHFMGICGSGAASIAEICVKAGYKVSGCDQKTDSYYAEMLKEQGVTIELGHDASHITDDVDVVAVSPAIFDVSPDNPELLLAKEKGILMTWQQFMGRYLQKDKTVIAISGTHGKTTSTFLTAEILIQGGLDPTVEGGSVYHKWNTGGRYGESDLFLCEADEFNRNFHAYSPETAVINNVEMDHPECYKNFEEVLESFTQFVCARKSVKTLIVNGDSEGAVEVLRRVSMDETVSKARVFVMFRDNEKPLPVHFENEITVVYHTLSRSEQGSDFQMTVGDKEYRFHTCLTGEYNVSNAVTASVIALSKNVSPEDIQAVLTVYRGAGRRFDLVGTRKNVPVYDDYAHHPTELRSLLTMCKEYFPEKKVLAIFEPHQIGRLKLMFEGYVKALCIADHVVIWRTHMGREIHSGLTPIEGSVWEAADSKIWYQEDVEEIVSYADSLMEKGECDMILVIGAASSYKISKRLIEED